MTRCAGAITNINFVIVNITLLMDDTRTGGFEKKKKTLVGVSLVVL